MAFSELESIKNISIPEHKAYCFNAWPLEYRRVKLYEVNPENGNWIDCGTGFLKLNKDNNKFNILVLSDEDPNFEKDLHSQRKNIEDLLEIENYNIVKLVNTPIDLNREYCHQKESIITWQDGLNSDLYRALSFQHSESCNSIWNMITSLVPHLCVDLLEAELPEESTSYSLLERPTSSNIDRIIDDLELDSNINSENIVMDLLSREFFDSLFNLMEEFEQNSDLIGLHKIFQVLRRIIVFYSSFNEVFEILLSDDYYLKFFKACEYDETLENYKIKFSHKKFLENVKFHSVVPLPEVRTIHLNYRLMYLRDVVMPRHLDEQSLQRIATIINNNFSSIISMIVTTSDIWKYLKENIQKNFLVAKFIHAVLTVLKQNPMLSIYERHQIFINLKVNNILCEFCGYLNENCIGARQMLELSTSNDDHKNFSNTNDLSFINYSNIRPIDLAVEIYSMVCEINPGLLRHAIHESTSQYFKAHKETNIYGSNVNDILYADDGLQNSPKESIKETENLSDKSNVFHSLWGTLCEIFINSRSESIQMQICAIFKRILDPKTMDVPERDDSLSLFYDMGILDRLIDSLLNDSLIFTEFNPLYSARVLFCDILATCVQEHNYRIKYKILQNQLPRKLLRIATRPFHKIFSISVIKFLRTCLGTRDDFYYRLFTKHDIFKYIFLIMGQLKVPRNRGEGSILESVVIEMLDFICRNNIQLILKYLLENYIVVICNLNLKASRGSKCRVFSRMLESFKLISKSTQSLNNCKRNGSNILSSNTHSGLTADHDLKSYFICEKRKFHGHKFQCLDRGVDIMDSFEDNTIKETANPDPKYNANIDEIPKEISELFEYNDFDNLSKQHKEHQKRPIRKKKIEIQLKLS
ncbi:PH domain containing protein [Cryptosporidium hominis]|uniref:PH domain containing protein n=1 Tax=Cryptosporidium hominis TaxID=237895 RepID=A0ABX5BCZ9_CRYHO|nr:PH domain containing protein [Cryptosporidium hominis]|eukprot:PPS93750.1 PH domain containing protein [Cryptosporidium hominis]